MALVISRLTREYVFFELETTDDLLGATAEVAFMDDPVALPGAPDWNDASLVDEGGVWFIRVLVGPNHVDSVDLTPAGAESVDYQVWTAIEDDPERIVRRPGVVTVE